MKNAYLLPRSQLYTIGLLIRYSLIMREVLGAGRGHEASDGGGCTGGVVQGAEGRTTANSDERA
jgi:hypothetical protein